jgi:hypothetical protein
LVSQSLCFDFFPPGQQQDARDVSERYIAKSDPWIVMVSTPNAPEVENGEGLLDKEGTIYLML